MIEKKNQITDDVIAIYNEDVEVILDLKRTQWQMTNYVTLLFVAMYALRTSMGGAAVPNLGGLTG